MFSCRNQTGKALTLFDGATTLVVIAQGQLAQNISQTVTSVKLGGATVSYRRKSGAFAGAVYEARIKAKDVVFAAEGQTSVIFG